MEDHWKLRAKMGGMGKGGGVGGGYGFFLEQHTNRVLVISCSPVTYTVYSLMLSAIMETCKYKITDNAFKLDHILK